VYQYHIILYIAKCARTLNKVFLDETLTKNCRYSLNGVTVIRAARHKWLTVSCLVCICQHIGFSWFGIRAISCDMQIANQTGNVHASVIKYEEYYATRYKCFQTVVLQLLQKFDTTFLRHSVDIYD